jgi:hypothetical protein
VERVRLRHWDGRSVVEHERLIKHDGIEHVVDIDEHQLDVGVFVVEHVSQLQRSVRPEDLPHDRRGTRHGTRAGPEHRAGVRQAIGWLRELHRLQLRGLPAQPAASRMWLHESMSGLRRGNVAQSQPV